MAPDAPGRVEELLDGLESALEAAALLTRELSGDPVFGRLLAAFQALPAEDRPVLVQAIEREAQARMLGRATEAAAGQSMVPNPNARLYLRVHESGIDRNLLERDEMMYATIRVMRAAAVIPGVPEIHQSWREACREAMEHVPEDVLAAFEGLVREILSFLVEARRNAAPDGMGRPG